MKYIQKMEAQGKYVTIIILVTFADYLYDTKTLLWYVLVFPRYS